jgi:hypothetical protein
MLETIGILLFLAAVVFVATTGMPRSEDPKDSKDSEDPKKD